MIFNSLQFIIFFPIVAALYFIINHRFRWILLLIASYYFYMCWNAKYAIILFISTIIDYFCSLMMDRTEEQSKRKKYLYISLFSNLGILFTFKYFNFFNESFKILFNNLGVGYNIPL